MLLKVVWNRLIIYSVQIAALFVELKTQNALEQQQIGLALTTYAEEKKYLCFFFFLSFRCMRLYGIYSIERLTLNKFD